MGEDNTTPTFSPEARAELLAMYTGMAMQGLIARTDYTDAALGSAAVLVAEATITALEKYHTHRAKLEQANAASPQ